MGGVMGWTPADVRACSLADFTAALDGWMRANVPENGGVDLSADDIRELQAMLDEDNE